MQVEIDGLHEQALLRLAQRNNEKTAVAMTRILIREAAKKEGVWPEVEIEEVPQLEGTRENV